MSTDLFKKWLKPIPTPHPGTSVFAERAGRRPLGLKTLEGLLANHFVGEQTILKAGGFRKAAQIVANSLPSAKKTQSGDLGELLATEYVNSETLFVVPIHKLRWKSDRQMAMHGNDVIGVDASVTPARVLKCECKSRARFSDDVAQEAAEGLDKHDGRPNPSTLAFITKRLYEENRDSEAKIFQDLQCAGTIAARNLTHMIFALSGNDPAKHLAEAPKSKHRGIKRENAAIVISDHSDFITAVYKTHGA
ncbi:MAG: DUF1837 domain-containing protein [Acidobacteriaceae bacterium]|nr:DUF1837 domain-containing protein [Acidobacteriaceae bacterium]